MSPTRDEPPLVYVLALDYKGAPDIAGHYVNLPAPRTPYTLRFTIEGTSATTRDASLWINLPDGDAEFDRKKFREIKYVDLRSCFQQ